jgi:lipopolysaccharide assembly outer membrane protein LptD (OstA)
LNITQHIYLLLLFFLLAITVFPQTRETVADSTLFETDTINASLSEIALDAMIDSIQSESDTINSSIKTDTIIKPKQIFDSPVSYKSADSMAVSLENGNQIVYLYGDANIKYGTIELTAGLIEVNLGTKEISARGLTDSLGNVTGKPHFKEGSEEFDCTALRYNFETEKGFVENVISAQQDGKVHGARAKMVSKDVFCMVDGKYSTCDAEHPHFYLHITKGKIIGKKAIVAGLSYLVLEDFPIYFPFLPYGFIPTNKTTYTSGVIIPTYGEIAERGYYLKDGGFYWAASDYFDVKLTGEIYSKGSWGLNIENRYRLRYKFSGNVGLSYRNMITGEKGINLQSQPSFSVRWSHTQDSKSNPSSSFSANIDFSTSGYSSNHEYDNAERYLQNSKSSRVSWRKNFMNTPLSMSANMSISQRTQDSTLSVSFPDMTINMRSVQPFKRKKRVGPKHFWEDFQLSYSASIRNSITTKESEFLSTPLTKWKRGVDHNLPITLPSFKILNYINITPSISYKERWFFDYTEKYWVDGYWVKDEATGMEKWFKGHVETSRKDGFKRNYEYSGGVGASTTLYGLYQMRNQNARINAVRHKMDMSISLSYHPDFGNPRYHFYDMVQIDSLGNLQQYNLFQGGIFSSTSAGESGSINFSMSNNIEMKLKNLNDSTTKEKFRKVAIFDNIGFSGSYNMAADSMRLSPISLNARTKIAGTSLNISGSLNPYALDSRGRGTSQYMWNNENATGLAKLGRITNLSTGFGFNFSSDQIEKKRKEKEKAKSGDKGNRENVEKTPTPENSRYQKFSMPWRLNFNYSIAYLNYDGKAKVNQTLSFSGNIDITEKWKATLSSGFDFEALKLTHTQIGITRDLHCWSMSFNFVPISRYPSYSFTLSANASMLKDLKILKSNQGF